jgi:hypothetical protein
MGLLKTPEKFSRELDSLQRDIFRAKIHFDIFNGLRQSWPRFNREISNAPCFWDFTVQAHIDAAVWRLCRIYDKHGSAFQLTRFLEESVQKNPNSFNEIAFRERLKNEPDRDVNGLAKYRRTLNHEQLKKDLRFCSNENPLVKNLRSWRDNVIAHNNYNEDINQSEPFHKRHPLPYEDIQKLIDEAFSIANSYSSLFRAPMHSEEFASKQQTDYQFVLESMTTHLDVKYPQWRKNFHQMTRAHGCLVMRLEIPFHL